MTEQTQTDKWLSLIFLVLALAAAMLILSSCTVVSYPTPDGRAYYGTFFQKKSLALEFGENGQIRKADYQSNTDEDAAARVAGKVIKEATK